MDLVAGADRRRVSSGIEPFDLHVPSQPPAPALPLPGFPGEVPGCSAVGGADAGVASAAETGQARRQSQPLRSAIWTASARLRAPSFWIAADRWLRTVPW